MRIRLIHRFAGIAAICLASGSLFAQAPVKPVAPSVPKTEPGLETAVAWKWWVVPSEGTEWGMPIPEALKPKPQDPAKPDAAKPVVERPVTYEVKKGDAVIKIAKKFGMEGWQLKQFNDLKTDMIHIGQVLRIPTQGEVLTLVPPAPPPAPKAEPVARKKPGKAIPVPEIEPESDLAGELKRELDTVRLQVFLDREMFSSGMIDGKAGAAFQKISELYQRSHEDAANPSLLQAKAELAVKDPYTRYALRAEDFKFINMPKDPPPGAASNKSTKKHGAKTDKSKTKAGPAPVTIDDLLVSEFLGYTNAWEFVAERFHCDEAFLHHINPNLKDNPGVGEEFQVPHVIPFEIEKALEAPLQPVADPQKVVTASVVLLSRLEIYRDGKLVAVMPLASARPGLRGRGSWTVIDAIGGPRMATKREPREVPKPKPAQAGDNAAPVPELPAAPPALEKEQYLPPGPNNPVGVLWINLSKDGSKEVLPYGLHGTGIPAKMGSLPGIGGFRMTNWDIVRAARLMPAGTALQWKAQ
jgi:LysM repeat protein/lipoprotein-anchoring transpeptidase ErfK/SrfK